MDASAAKLRAKAAERDTSTPLGAVAGDGIAARRITRSIAAELSIAVLALAFVAAWRFTPPPRALLAAAEAPVHVHIHSDKAMADLTIEPAAGGGRQITWALLRRALDLIKQSAPAATSAD